MQIISSIPQFHLATIFCKTGDYSTPVENTSFSVGLGIGKPYSEEESAGGSVITRLEINAIGRLSSYGLFLSQIGHVFQPVSSKQYEEFAFMESVEGLLARRMVFDGERWKYADNVTFPDVFDVT